MKNSKVLFMIGCVMLLAVMMFAATPTKTIPQGKKEKVEGKIISRNGDWMVVREKKDTVIVNLTDDTKVEREKGPFRLRRADMDLTAMVPGLKISAEGVGNEKGQLDAKRIWFNPNVFDVEVAAEHQILANREAATHVQNTANQGVQQAQAAQASADQAAQDASDAGDAAALDAYAISLVNKRVSDLADYKVVVESGIYFPTDVATLDTAAKADLDILAKATLSINNYMIEVAGYASSTGTKELNQRLSDARAAAVVDYLRNEKNIPMRRILVPAGYGATHFSADNTDAKGRALNQRVDVKVLVNKGLSSSL
jgi:outer membrane protein OmpA-like peptidoglycan-associated protein